MELAEYIATAEVSTTETELHPGWTDFWGQARKFHYFPDDVPGTRALCGKWAIFTKHELQPDTGAPSKDDCKACGRKLRST